MHRSTEFKKKLKSYSNNCIHTKNIYSLIDIPELDESYKSMSKHLETCLVCSLEFKTFQQQNAIGLTYIPKVSMDRDLRQSFEREVAELFKLMDLSDRENLKKNVKKGFLTLDKMGIEFIQNLLSRTMLKTYFIAATIFIFLRFLI